MQQPTIEPPAEATEPTLQPPDPDVRITELEQQLTGLTAELAQAREALDAAERRHAIERELIRAKAIDLETAALLTEAAIQNMDDADVAHAVAELRRAKPFLFRNAPAGSAATAAIDDGNGELTRAADAARETGDRRALIRYLRLRRGA